MMCIKTTLQSENATVGPRRCVWDVETSDYLRRSACDVKRNIFAIRYFLVFRHVTDLVSRPFDLDVNSSFTSYNEMHVGMNKWKWSRYPVPRFSDYQYVIRNYKNRDTLFFKRVETKTETEALIQSCADSRCSDVQQRT